MKKTLKHTKPSATFYIVTPSFNQAHFLSETIASVLSQSGVKLEYWVMDAKSSDDTLKVLKSFGKKLQWESKKDKGQTDAINKGLKKFQKLKPTKELRIFAYINSDDYYQPEAFTQVVAAFKNNPEAQWLVGDCQIIDSQGRTIQSAVRWYKKLWRLILSPSILAILNPIPQPAVFIKWEAVEKTGLFNQDLRYVMDYEYWWRLYHQVGAPLVIPQILAAFRIHGDSKGGSQFVKQFAEELQIARQYTQNSAWLLLHSVHNEMIKAIYKVIK